MGKRREPRKPVSVPVRIFGTDRDGKIFSENLTTADISQNGVRLQGLKSQIKIDEIVGVTFGTSKVHFRVKWVGAPGTPAEGQAGLLNLSPQKPFWNIPLPHAVMDNFQSSAAQERRTSARVRCEISVELHALGQPVVWAKAADLSHGGCFVEMPIPLKIGNKLEIVLWLGSGKLRVNGEVVSSSPGFGIGVRFVNLTTQSQEFLQKHIKSLA